MPTTAEITTFSDVEPPPGQTPWVLAPQAGSVAIVDPNPDWPSWYAEVADHVHGGLGARVLDIFHIGSTAVPGLPAKPIIDIDLIIADPSRESDWVSALTSAGFTLTVREPWWHEHRVLRFDNPRANVHIFGPDAPEPWRHRIFRDHLRRDAKDRALYADAKLAASQQANQRGETVMEYNLRKQAVVRDIYGRAFRAAGLTA